MRSSLLPLTPLVLSLLAAPVSAQEAAPSTPPPASPSAPPSEARDSATAAPRPQEGSSAGQPGADAPPPITTLVTQQLVNLGCSAQDVVLHAERYYAVCGKGSVWVMGTNAEGQLAVHARHRVGGAVRDLFVQSDRVWVVSTRETAEPVEDAPLEGSAETLVIQTRVPAEPPPPPGSFGVPGGRVLSSREQRAVVSIGSAQGLRLGGRVEIYDIREEPDPERADAPRSAEHSVLIGKVVSVAEQRATLALGFGEFARPGMRARITTEPLSANKNAPARLGELLLLEGSLHPFLPMEELGFAVLGKLSATYLFAREVYARLEARPLGALWNRDAADTGMFGVYASAGYDHRYFALGLGAGTLYTREREDTWEFDASYGSHYRSHERTGLRFGVLQHVRLGSRDGLHFTSTSAVRLADSRWRFGWLDGALQIPLNARSWLLLRASGGQAPGHVLTEVGFRRLVRGNGADGSLFVRPSAGFSGIANPEAPNRFIVGPMVGVHLEGRLAL